MNFEVEVELHKNFIKVNRDKIVVGLSSRPKKGKANIELIKKLAKHFNISSSQVRIKSGLKSRKKIVEIIKD